MAAHGLNILWDFVAMVGKMGNTYTEDDEYARLQEQMVTALNYAPGMDTPIIGPEDWSDLRKAVINMPAVDILRVLSELIPYTKARWV